MSKGRRGWGGGKRALLKQNVDIGYHQLRLPGSKGGVHCRIAAVAQSDVLLRRSLPHKQHPRQCIYDQNISTAASARPPKHTTRPFRRNYYAYLVDLFNPLLIQAHFAAKRLLRVHTYDRPPRDTLFVHSQLPALALAHSLTLSQSNPALSPSIACSPSPSAPSP